MKGTDDGRLITGKSRSCHGGSQGNRSRRRAASVERRRIVADIDEKNGTELAGASARVSFVRCDVSDEKQILAVLDKVDSRFGRLDILVNDAAWQLNKPLLETATEEFEQVMRINVTGSFIFLRESAKRMIAKGIPGAIVNFASTFAVVGSPGYLAYHASKGAIASMTRAAAIALQPHGIRVNAVAPGTVDTPGLHDGARDTGDERHGLESFLALQPLKRFGQPEEIANVVRFLVDEQTSFVHGAVVMADGGYTIV